MLPIGTALVSTGLGGWIGTALTTALIGYGPLALVVGFYMAAVLLTQLVGVAVAVGCSAAFLSPVAHPVNVLMMEPGGYAFGDFVRIGAGQMLVCLLTLLVVMPIFWGL
jgi:di/tricarboxylate transporter